MTGGKRGKEGEKRWKRGGEKTRTAWILAHGFFLILAAVESAI